ncbi:MAG: hypothetical protein HY652_02010 [Acidobacteria bacterium]|nr:hypothetical protein [Acidobacteriota bacterium]
MAFGGFCRRLPSVCYSSGKQEEVNFCDYGIQLTRGFRALKLWMSLKVFGSGAFRQSIERGLELARLAENAVREFSGWEVVTPAQMGVVTFRYAPVGMSPDEVNALNRDLVEGTIREGFAMISSTELHGCTVLRMCLINPRTTEEDIRQTLQRLDRLARHAPRWPP